VNFEERIMAAFRRETPDRTPWMPRLEHWYNVNKVLGTHAPEHQGLGLIQVYAELNAAARVYAFADSVYGMPGVASPITTRCSNVETDVREEGSFVYTTVKTPIGELQSKERRTEHGFSQYYVDYPVKSPEDLKTLEYILENTAVEFNLAAFHALEKRVGGQGMLWWCFLRTPIQRCFINYLGFEKTIIFLRRYPAEMEHIIRVMEETDNPHYELVRRSPFKVVNLGENIDSRLTSPKLFERYHLPYYQRRCEELHRDGKYVTCHVDGYAAPLLSLLRETGLDGVEALTPKPVGDFTIEEMKNALGDMVLVDGIPFYHFLPHVPLDEFKRVTRKVIRLFGPRLVLGISDEMPPGGDVNRLRLVNRIIDQEKPRA